MFGAGPGTTLASSGYSRVNFGISTRTADAGAPVVTVDATRFREALSRFASGVCVITTVGVDDSRPVGVTISAFSSLSLDPPLVLFCIGKRSANLKAWLNGRAA